MIRLTFSLLAIMTAQMAHVDAYSIQLHWGDKASADMPKTGIVIPGIFGCMKIPAPGLTTNDLKVQPDLTRGGCWKNSTSEHRFYAGESNGITVYDPPHCDTWPPLKPKGCPSAGLVSIHFLLIEGQAPNVTCSTSEPAFPSKYTIQCKGPMAADDPQFDVKFSAVVVRKTAEILV
mmetsp:Transcript_25428/g.49796  ORF Transcript_25428/g.49796 Transcript_25428/m.49796 type:complete len:176 (-) Transcript_25428:68-595(-)